MIVLVRSDFGFGVCPKMTRADRAPGDRALRTNVTIRVIRLIRVVASRLVGALLRIAKRWAAPGAGPKLAAG